MSVLNRMISGTLAPLIETNERYIMQGQVYDKETLKFEFMNFLPQDQSTCLHKPALVRRCTSIYDTLTDFDWHTQRTRGDMYIVDNNDPTITYAFLDTHIQSSVPVIYNKVIKISTQNDISNIIWAKTGTSSLSGGYGVVGHSATFVEIIGQSDNYIFVVINRSHKDGSNARSLIDNHVIKKIDKSTGDWSDIYEYNTCNQWYVYGIMIRKIYDDSNCFVFSVYDSAQNTTAINTISPSVLAIYKYNKKDNTLVLLDKVAPDAGAPITGYNVYTSQGFMLNSKLCFYYYTNLTDPKVKLVTVDIVTNTITNSVVLTTFNDKVKSYPIVSTPNNAMVAELFLKQYGGKTYLNIIGYSTRGAVSEKYFNRITTFLVDDATGNLIAQGYCDPFNNTAIRGFVECIDERLLLVTNRTAVKVLRFDTVNGVFVEMQTIDIPNNTIGCDSKDNVWINDTNNTLHKFTIELPTKVNLTFDDPGFDYQGITIDSNMSLVAYNYLNERAEVKLQLTIKGPMTFADGSKTLNIASSKTETIKIPIKVIGSGVISVFPKILI